MSRPFGDESAPEPILLSPPDVTELEADYVLAAIRSGWVAPIGPDLTAFENEMKDRLGVRYAVGLASGTAALHLALVSWGVGPGDVVPVSTFTFAATVNAIRYVGAEPHFVDSDEETGNISPSILRQAVDDLRAQGRKVPVIVPVDLLGKCADYEPIAEIAGSIGARLLCDSAESLGATYAGRPAGSFGDASVLSFNGNKIMTTSGGGMLLTNDRRLADHVRKLSTQAREPVPHYEHTEIGYNYRLSNILAALGRGQLSRLDEMLKRRRAWRERYRQLIADQPGFRILGGADDADDNCWLTALVVDPECSAWSVDDLAAAMQADAIETRPIWKPMHLQPVFQEMSSTLDGTSERIFAQGVTLPSGSGMTDDQFARVAAVLRQVSA